MCCISGSDDFGKNIGILSGAPVAPNRYATKSGNCDILSLMAVRLRDLCFPMTEFQVARTWCKFRGDSAVLWCCREEERNSASGRFLSDYSSYVRSS